MPRRKRSRRHKKFFGGQNNFSNANGSGNGLRRLPQDHVMRDFSEEASLNRTPEASSSRATFKALSPRVLVMDLRSRAGSYVSDSSLHCHSLNCSELKQLFNTNNSCHSSPALDENSNKAKFQSPDLIAHIATQTLDEVVAANAITETPRVSHDDLLELDYPMEPLPSPVSGYQTPLKRMRPNSITPIFDMKDSAVRIQDLNNLQNEKTEQKIQNTSRIFNSDSLKRLQNFNELILNTSQSIDYDNCEMPQEVEDVLHEANSNPEEMNVEELSGTEVSFFTPQLYNGKSASTPIEKNIKRTTSEAVSAEKISRKIIKPKGNVSASTQVDKSEQNHIGVQTNAEVTPLRIRNKDKALSVPVSRRRSYRSLQPTVVYYKASPKLQAKNWQLVRAGSVQRASLERFKSIDSTTAIEVCAKIFSKIKKYHGRYSSKLPAKIFDICTWLGLTIKKGIISLYQMYIEQNPIDEDPCCSNSVACIGCHGYTSQMSTLTATIDNLRKEVAHLKHENKHSNEAGSLLHTELELIRRQLLQFEDIKKDLHDIKDRLTTQPAMPAHGVRPPPPPPPPPPLLPNVPLTINKAKPHPKKKTNENVRPIISLNDILNVKLRKTCERPTPIRRATDPLISSSLKLKLKPTSGSQTPSSTASPSSASSLSNSPRSSLTRILSNVDTNVRRVKRLQRQGAYSFDTFSRRSPLARRDREN